MRLVSRMDRQTFCMGIITMRHAQQQQQHGLHQLQHDCINNDMLQQQQNTGTWGCTSSDKIASTATCLQQQQKTGTWDVPSNAPSPVQPSEQVHKQDRLPKEVGQQDGQPNLSMIL